MTSRYPAGTEENTSQIVNDSSEIRVLLVDDDRDFVTLASTLLETENERIETRTETDPRDALDRVDLGEIDCVVSDYRMPEMDGIGFLESVRAEHPELPFILFTGKGSEEIAQRAISAGVSDYIVKDGSPEQYAISANRIENLVRQHRIRRRSAHRRRLDTLTRQAVRTILDEPAGEAIERGVCDRLAASELYSFVWIGARDPRTDRIRPHAQAGEGGLLDSVSFSPDREPPQSVEERALATGERQVEAAPFPDTGSREWYSELENRGFEAAIGIPIVHGEIPYGVLGVYTSRADAFSTAEVNRLGMLADLTAFSIAAGVRRQGDTSRQIVEIEFDVGNADLPFVRIASDLGCTARLSHTSDRGDGTALAVYSIEGASLDRLRDIEAPLDVDTIQVSEHSDPGHEITVVSSDPWWSDFTELYGANVAEAIAHEEGATLSVELPPSVDVRTVTDLIEDRYPGAEPIARRQRPRSERSIEEVRTLFGERLTDRQREVIETAYRAGYYEWPHRRSSEEVAEMLGISQPTFAEHFWTGQRRICELLLDDLDDLEEHT